MLLSVEWPRLTDAEELLYRQVHPSWMRDGRVSSQAFTPTKKDQGQLSTARSAMTSPKGAFRLHTEGRGLPSAGTWAVSVAECEAFELRVFHAPTTCPPEPVADPAHAIVDFSTLESNSRKDAMGAKLAQRARERGCLFAPATG
jgi:hypothetical protein